jgi:hypothetical protein
VVVAGLPTAAGIGGEVGTVEGKENVSESGVQKLGTSTTTVVGSGLKMKVAVKMRQGGLGGSDAGRDAGIGGERGRKEGTKSGGNTGSGSGGADKGRVGGKARVGLRRL